MWQAIKCVIDIRHALASDDDFIALDLAFKIRNFAIKAEIIGCNVDVSTQGPQRGLVRACCTGQPQTGERVNPEPPAIQSFSQMPGRAFFFLPQQAKMNRTRTGLSAGRGKIILLRAPNLSASGWR
ncbi:MAG: hypothetical protein II336_04010 [Loktanella sp.]|nr:hypothetical protein [Loktanella sp.]